MVRSFHYMQAVILAAGRSTRTYPLTTTRPKPLIPIWDRPFLELQLAQLGGIAQEAILVVGYRREQIESYFGNEHLGLRLRYVEQVEQRGTADAVLAARPHVTERVLVLNGDDFYHHDDLAALADAGRALLVTRAPDPENRAVVEIDEGTIVNIVEKPAHPRKDAWCSVGGYCVEASDLTLLDDLPVSARGELELPDFVLRLVNTTRVKPQYIGRWWLPLTYAWDVLVATRYIWSTPERARELGFAETTAAIGPDVEVEGPIWLGERVQIGSGVHLIGPTSVGAGTTIASGARLERVAIFDGVHIGERTKIGDSVLGTGVHVGADVVLETRRGKELAIDVNGKRIVPGLDRMGSVLGDGVSIEDGVRVAAGSLMPAAARSA